MSFITINSSSGCAFWRPKHSDSVQQTRPALINRTARSKSSSRKSLWIRDMQSPLEEIKDLFFQSSEQQRFCLFFTVAHRLAFLMRRRTELDVLLPVNWSRSQEPLISWQQLANPTQWLTLPKTIKSFTFHKQNLNKLVHVCLPKLLLLRIVLVVVLRVFFLLFSSPSFEPRCFPNKTFPSFSGKCLLCRWGRGGNFCYEEKKTFTWLQKLC